MTKMKLPGPSPFLKGEAEIKVETGSVQFFEIRSDIENAYVHRIKLGIDHNIHPNQVAWREPVKFEKMLSTT